MGENPLLTYSPTHLLASIGATGHVTLDPRNLESGGGRKTALAIGFLRKDVAVGMLGALGLSAHQLVIGCTVLAMFFPCIASFVVLARELGIRDMLKATGIMLLVAILVGGGLNLVL